MERKIRLSLLILIKVPNKTWEEHHPDIDKVLDLCNVELGRIDPEIEMGQRMMPEMYLEDLEEFLNEFPHVMMICECGYKSFTFQRHLEDKETIKNVFICPVCSRERKVFLNGKLVKYREFSDLKRAIKVKELEEVGN